MAHIEILRPHTLGRDRARESAENVAEQLNEHFSLDYYWEGDALCFERSGVSGQMEVAELEVRVKVRLGLMLSPMKGRLEREINHYMDKVFEDG